MTTLPVILFLLCLELRHACKPEYTMKYRQLMSRKSDRKGRQLDNSEPTCDLKDPRLFLQALVVSRVLVDREVGSHLSPTGQGRSKRQARGQSDKGVKGAKEKRMISKTRKGRKKVGGWSRSGRAGRNGHCKHLQDYLHLHLNIANNIGWENFLNAFVHPFLNQNNNNGQTTTTTTTTTATTTLNRTGAV